MTFYFYDLETTGFNPHEGRIMQFAGQRTDMQLKPIGKADNMLIKLSDDILPDPDAVLITGITPQKTLQDGLTEADFCQYFADKINQAGTIFVGYNNIRFDDEFMRHLFYRNFYDAYEWQWQDNNSRWDLLDVVRMTRALRPAGINWPYASDGSPSNQLGLLTSVNKLDHLNAHDALSDVQATIALAGLLQEKQPKLFKFMLDMRAKQAVAKLVSQPQPFVYTSGKYPSQFEKTTVVAKIAEPPRGDGVLVYDLRFDPADHAKLSIEQMVKAWRNRDPAEGPILPVKTLKFNRCPAVAPLNVLDKDSQSRLQLDLKIIEANLQKLRQMKEWPEKLLKVLDQLDRERQDRLLPDEQDVDNQLYNGFFDRGDKQAMRVIRSAQPDELSQLAASLKDNRLQALLPLYKARNYKQALSHEELVNWEKYRSIRLLTGGQNSRLAKYLSRVEELKQLPKQSKQAIYLLTELELYGQSIMPELN
ncbi:MAG: exodeoxyribonuclease I [Candidatus Saccharimonadales bacterium]